MSVKEELKGITPTYQAVLNSQLKKVADAFDGDDVVDLFIKLKVLIGLLRPKDRDPLLENEIAHIQKELNQVRQQRGADHYQTWLIRHSGVKRVLRQNLWSLFLNVLTQLHKGKYLAITKEITRGRYGR